jgi:hypothetical protein
MNYLIEKYKLINILKIIIILLLLFIIYRLCTQQYISKNENNSIIVKKNESIERIESFVASQYNSYGYGNTLCLQNTKNIPIFTQNQCKFNLDNVYRIDSLIFVLEPTMPITADNITSIYIQYTDGNGNLRYLKHPTILTSPPNLDDSAILSGSGTVANPFVISLNDIVDENGLIVYTSQIILTVNDNSDTIKEYIITNTKGYIKKYGIYGGTRALLLKNEYDALANTLIYYTFTKQTSASSTPNITVPSTIGMHLFSNPTTDNIKIYSLKLTTSQIYNTITSATPTNTPTTTKPVVMPDTPFYVTIKYQNSFYPSNNFTITNTYKVRSDIYRYDDTSISTFIFLDKPIIANQVTFQVQMPPNYTLHISDLIVNGNVPTASDIDDYKKNINLQLNQSNTDETNICPSIDNLLDTQKKTQQICDNLEYQDKVKAEKLRLERNKQYLLKLQNQQNQIDELNTVIQDLESKRASRDKTSDQARLLQYQSQKANASSIRDLANQRLESQDNNKLFMDVKLNYTKE